MSVAYQDVPRTGLADATMITRITQQLGASFGTAIVAVALQTQLSHGAAAAFGSAFWWATGIATVALVPALVFGRSPGTREAHGERRVAPLGRRTAAR